MIRDLLGVLLYLLISGDVLYVGLVLVVAGIVAAKWRVPFADGVVWIGVTLTLASAIPINAGDYAVLLLCSCAWQASQIFATKYAKHTSIALGGAVLLLLAAALTDRLPKRLDLPHLCDRGFSDGRPRFFEAEYVARVAPGQSESECG